MWEMTWRNKWITSDAESIDDMINGLRRGADQLEEMKKAGIYLADCTGTADDYALLITEDPEVAARFEFHPSPTEEEENEGLSEEVAS
jgi:hypothetical protein